MIIEIKGIGFPNRGAELMLLAIQQEFDKRNVSAKFVIEPQADFILRSKYKLYQKSRFIKKNINFGWPLSFIPKPVRKRYGIINASEIDLVIDASGFAYSDRWGKDLINNRIGKEIFYFKKNKVKVIMLPQAFGPFNNKDVYSICKKVLSQCDVVIARDRESLSHLDKLGLKNKKLYPDFTNLVEPSKDTDPKLEDRVCIIPNFQMIEQAVNGSEYLEIMKNCVNFLLENGKLPFFLIHEGEKDLNIAKQISSMSQVPIEIVDPKDALEIKTIISKSSLVISSRFHGLVSALSCNVPVLATGWSHKYKMLLDDYGVIELLCELNSDDVIKKLNKLIHDEKYIETIVERLSNKSIEQKKLSNSMWDQVFDCILN